MAETVALEGYRPGALAALVALHMDYYAPVWGLGLAFETELARDMGAFLPAFDADRDLFLAAYDPAGALIGSVTVDGRAADGEGARLRWFIVGEQARGTGLGRELIERAVSFLDRHEYRRTYLTTFAGLDAARRLYERHGFRLARDCGPDPWTGTRTVQRFERIVD